MHIVFTLLELLKTNYLPSEIKNLLIIGKRRFTFNTNLNVLSRCANMHNSDFFHLVLYLNNCNLQLAVLM